MNIEISEETFEMLQADAKENFRPPEMQLEFILTHYFKKGTINSTLPTFSGAAFDFNEPEQANVPIHAVKATPVVEKDELDVIMDAALNAPFNKDNLADPRNEQFSQSREAYERNQGKKNKAKLRPEDYQAIRDHANKRNANKINVTDAPEVTIPTKQKRVPDEMMEDLTSE